MGARYRLARPTRLARELRDAPTDAEAKLWQQLRARQLYGYGFSRRLPIAGFICDLVCREARLIIEVDGGEHDVQRTEDAARTARLEAAGYRVIRFWNNEVLGNVDGVLAEIARALEAH